MSMGQQEQEQREGEAWTVLDGGTLLGEREA